MNSLPLAGSPAAAPHARFLSTSSKAPKETVRWGKVPTWMKHTINRINKQESKAEDRALREAFNKDLAESRKRSDHFLKLLKAGLPLPEVEEEPQASFRSRVPVPVPIKDVWNYGFADHFGVIKENGEDCFVTHPYLADSHIEQVKEFCARTGFTYEVGGFNFYHQRNRNVTATTRITIRRGVH